jgi:hypothetical protein
MPADHQIAGARHGHQVADSGHHDVEVVAARERTRLVSAENDPLPSMNADRPGGRPHQREQT